MESLTLKGLTSQEAIELLKKSGKNVLPEAKRFRAVAIFFSQFPTFINLILSIAAVISVVIGDYTDAFLIFSILILNAIFGFIQEYRAEKAIEKLKKLATSEVRVVRDGKETSIDSSLLVPGDVVILSDGDRIPADGRIIKSNRLEVDESILTGESMPVLKKDSDILFSGTMVSKGKAYMEVSATGLNTKFGKIAKGISSIEADKTPLEKKLTQLGRYITIIVVATSALLVPLGIMQGKELYPLLLLAVSIGVAAIPEGLPAVVTIALAIGVSRMAKKKAIVRKMPSVETLGAVQLIITDKTGTLTQNQMKVREHWPLKETLLPDIILASVLNNASSIVSGTYEGAVEIVGDKTDGALLYWASQHEPNYQNLRKNASIVDEYLFDTETKSITTVVKEGESLKVLVRGAPEEILERSENVNKEEIEKKIDEYASLGLRVIGFASKKIGSSDWKKSLESDLEFIGLIGIYDPPRVEAKDAIREARNAGIRTIMVTGDNEITALAIAKEIGLVEEDGVITGDGLKKLTDEELDKEIERVSVFARIEPEDKLRIVEAAKRKGLIVGVTGDGINDTLALKRADVGIAMGDTGTDVAKEAADIVLSDDNYSTIVHAVEEGRKIYDNILKAITYLLTSNLSEISLIVLAFLLNMPLPLLPTQILWINLVTDGLPALALASDKKSPDILKRSPRNPHAPILSKERLTFIFSFGFGLAILLLAVFYLSLQSHSEVFARTVVFNTLIFSHMMLAFIVRGRLLFRGNRLLVASVLFTIFLQVIITVTPFFQDLFKIGF
ncbi:MAG: hypothetical protein A2186_01685 [Candidatus Levybacteria bacterium RIFOXYA1_FULL_41_10]|nr:MAG: Cation-transporting ATPase [Candidatus Levybacteria bacterium GW2011_GWA1_39_32]KKR51522.1 MAG: Cation-transporting ATPase [Candidatus Levybacteria bacterium GW2011_GWC1_40_19]KKR95414.1 MAG: Cation-transporting ATPase [Candidatus Levybacteria bacterium GW2011_GWA2_41_15]KKS01899.1 MAG: Cation-transporting ATPase [Candidatus Levybacteria bacterium GW2011_GWB1_41_21]OGH20903.1 MAG: hypothetical protein A2695_02835 [Candidatus Levybacteria bacterium RIFCSPHIGHO2_01_FULL_40_83]OGH25963.1 